MPKGRRTALDYIDIVYEGALRDYFNSHTNPATYLLMEDGAPVHTARVSATWLGNQGISKLKWPANSPDLNPIENIWNLCKAEVQKLPRAKNANKLSRQVVTVWNKVAQNEIARYIETMPTRIRKVIEAKGGSTKW